MPGPALLQFSGGKLGLRIGRPLYTLARRLLCGPLCCSQVFLGVACAVARSVWHRGYGATVARLTPDQKVGSSNLSALIVDVSISSPPPRPICVCRRGLGIFRLASYLQIEMGQQGRHQEPAR